MDHQIELGYLVVELPEPETLTPVLADVVGLVPGEPAAGARAPGGTTRAPSGSWWRPGRPTTRWSSASRRSMSLRSTRPSIGSRKFGADVASGTDDDLRASVGSADWSAPPPRGASTIELVPGSRTRRRRTRHLSCRVASSPRMSGSGTSCSQPRPSTSRCASSPTVSGSSSPTGSRPSWLLGSISRSGSSTATPGTTPWRSRSAPFELPQSLHHVMFEANSPRRRRGRVRPSLGCGAADPERARPARQRRDVQLLPADARRLPDRGRLRRACGRRRLGRQPSLQPHQRLGSPAAARGMSGTLDPSSGDVDCDVAIVGAGPTGLVLAVLLAQLGRSVVVVEQRPAPYPLPRAVHFDDEVGRLLQSCGIGDELRAVSEPAEVYEWRNAAGTTLLRFGRIGTGTSGWPFSSMFCQPELEALLEARARRLADDRDPSRRRRRRARAAPRAWSPSAAAPVTRSARATSSDATAPTRPCASCSTSASTTGGSSTTG